MGEPWLILHPATIILQDVTLICPMQPMKPIARRDPKVIHARREIQILQLSYRPLPYFWQEPLRLAFLVQLLCASVDKGLDHTRSVM